MKKKIRNFFKIILILAIVITFVIPGIAKTKPKSLEETLGISDAEIGWVPVDASGSHTIAGHEIFLHETGQLVTLEIHVSGWNPNLLKALQATVDSTGYSNGVGGSLNPLGWPGSPEDGCFIDTSRSDYVFNGMAAVDAVYTGDLNFIWGATLLSGGKADDDQTYYLGTLILEVPSDASDTYTIGFLPDDIKTFMQDDNGQKIVPLILTSSLISINQLPNAPTITGTTSGKVGTSYPYTFTSTDPDGDQVSYYIEWGDGTTTDWTAFQTSGPPGYTEAHAWDIQDEYTITAKAKDINGLVGPEETLTVTMPRNKAINSPFLNYLQNFLTNHPNLFPIFQRLFLRLGLRN